MNILLITPPFTQLNTPYPATTQLKAFLVQEGHTVKQYDMGIELANQIFTRSFLKDIFDIAFSLDKLSFKARGIASKRWAYEKSIDNVWRFLQGKDETLATKITTRGYLPEAGRFKNVKDENLEWAFGSTGNIDRAKHLATLYIEDLSDFIADIVSSSFQLVRYGEQLSISAPTFDEINNALQQENNLIDNMMLNLVKVQLDNSKYDLVGFSVPFPGTLFGALKCGEYIKKHYNTPVAIGGGYVNTELRELTDTKIFGYTDYILFDDGELPLQRLTTYLSEKTDENKEKLVRTKYCENNIVIDSGNYDFNIDFADLPAPDFSDLDFSKYVSFIEVTNPMHKLWSDGRWNKITVAHGCYWAKCAFCDTSLDYIKRYEAPSATDVVDKMERIMAQTQISGFHFTDEALPPKLLRQIAQEIIDRKLCVSFWGNIRFEKTFTPELCALLAEAGCIAVSGGIEVASDRVLKLINKGVTIEGAKKCCSAFADNGIMVHAYLMYGFPTQTAQECVRSLDIIRGWFEEGILQSAFWHRFAMTVHSPTGLNPEKYGCNIIGDLHNSFANNAIEFEEDSDVDWDAIGDGLRRATSNYMHGLGFNIPLKKWIKL